jgi:uncharacterized protein DUF4350
MSTAATSASATHSARPPAGGGLTLPIVGVVCAVVLMVVGALLAGRRDEILPTVYGRRRGSEASRSVNGTAVLAEFFRRAGNRVTTLSRFSPKLEQFDVIVWVPDDFKPPSKERREWLENWLRNGSGRTVVYVGRDYNAAIDYWERMVPQTPEAQADEALHRQAEARAEWEAARSKMPTKDYACWFTARRDEKPRKIESFSGPWADGIEPKQTNVRLEGCLAMPSYDDVSTLDDPFPPANVEPLLMSEQDALAFRLINDTLDTDDWNKGKIIVIANGSFVLNYPLVNHEHRKLADQLVRECGTGRKVIFIESGPDGPPILKKEPTGGFPTAMELLKVWPLNAILLHLTVLGIVLCLSRSPIFGRPRELPADSPTDFGKHVAALGKLLARTHDRNYAQARLVQYRQIAERRSGRSHLKNK